MLAICVEAERDTCAGRVPNHESSNGVGRGVFGRNECTRVNPVKVEVGEGEHVMVGVAVGGWSGLNTRSVGCNIGCNNITIVGKGKCKTTLLGGFYVNGKQNVKIEQLGVTTEVGCGLFCEGSRTNVDVTECCFQKCQYAGMDVDEGATVTATRCEFMENGNSGVTCRGANTTVRLNDSTIHHNGWAGLAASDGAVVDLHGTKTDIHSNKVDGIYASAHAKVNIHLPSQHNTIHDNGDANRFQQAGGSIANINADGTFTHVVVEDTSEEEDDY